MSQNLPLSGCAALTREKPFAERQRALHEIRRLLLCDQPNEAGHPPPLRLIDRGLSERSLAELIGCSRVPVREALAVLRAFGVVKVPKDERRYEVTLLVDPQGELKNDELRENVKYELLNNGRAGLTRFVETAASLEERSELLQPLARELDEAIFRAEGRHGNSNLEPNPVCRRAEAVLAATDTVAGIADLAGLQRTSDVVRSGLDIVEISSRYRQEKQNPAAELFSLGQVYTRINDCRALVNVLSLDEGDDECIVKKAHSAFESYITHRFDELDAAITHTRGAALAAE